MRTLIASDLVLSAIALVLLMGVTVFCKTLLLMIRHGIHPKQE